MSRCEDEIQTPNTDPTPIQTPTIGRTLRKKCCCYSKPFSQPILPNSLLILTEQCLILHDKSGDKLRPDNNVVLQARALFLHDQSLGEVRWDGITTVKFWIHAGTAKKKLLHNQSLKGKGGRLCNRVKTMFLYQQRHGNRQRFLMINYCWFGLGWNGIIKLIFQVLSCWSAITSATFSSSGTAWVDWDGMRSKNVISWFTHRHDKFDPDSHTDMINS